MSSMPSPPPQTASLPAVFGNYSNVRGPGRVGVSSSVYLECQLIDLQQKAVFFNRRYGEKCELN